MTNMPEAVTVSKRPSAEREAPRRAVDDVRQALWRDRYGPWAVVTGASSGIGHAIARQLAQAGLHLVVVARSERLLLQLASELRAAHDVKVRVLAVDLADAEALHAVQVETAELDVGLLVAAAGFGTSGAFIDGALDAELSMLDVNCRAVLTLSHEFGRRLALRGRGGIVLMGSLVGFQGTPYAAHYAATKAYVQTLAEALHVELEPRGVDVLASAPGPVHTGFAERANMRMGAAITPEVVARQTLAALGRRSTVAPGLLTKVLTYSLAPLPRWARVRIMSGVMGGMTKHQRESGVRNDTTRHAAAR